MKTSKRKRRTFETQQKATAVLSIWTERRTATEVCRDMGVSWALVNQWQNQAMEGMIAGLEPKKKQHEVELNARLTKLIEKSIINRNGTLAGLQQRLAAIQKGKPKKA